LALVLDGFRVTVRTCHSGSLRKTSAIDPLWLPVAPRTTMIFLELMIEDLD
jgi:hypothetical protein